MGGWGSGRKIPGGPKPDTTSFRRLDVRALKRDGGLVKGTRYSLFWRRREFMPNAVEIDVAQDCLTLRHPYWNTKEGWLDLSYTVPLTRTACHLGGERPWFICPVPSCSRRVAILYGAVVFACRTCHGAAYPSQSETPEDRLIRKNNRLRRRLGWEPGIFNRPKGKPKGMHWRTYHRLEWQHTKMVERILAQLRVELQYMRTPRRSPRRPKE